MASADEFAVLITAATVALQRSLGDGDAHGYDGDWYKQTLFAQLTHASRHIDRSLSMESIINSPNSEGDLDHAITRLLMAKVLSDRERYLKYE